MTVAALATSAGVAPAGSPPESAASRSLRLTAHIDGQPVDRDAVLRWEARRLQVAAERLSHRLAGALLAELDALLRRPAISTENVARDRQLLADVKMHLGEARIRKLLAPDLAVTGAATKVAAGLNRWSVSSIELSSSLGTAQGFVDWFNARGDFNDERAMLVACPDHYLIRSPRPGVLEVIEVTGGAMLGSRFVIDISDSAGVPIEEDSLYPVRVSGWARTDKGSKIGGVRHQFRDDPEGGFSAKLAVVFPATLPPWMVSEHRWHLACEFSNWVSGYIDVS